MWRNVGQGYMVSRSLEKMMLIAVGLSTAVIIGVPVLLYAIDTMSYSSQLQHAQTTASDIFQGISSVDDGDLNSHSIQVQMPSEMSLSVSNQTLTITVTIRGQISSWNQEYQHSLVVSNAPTAAGLYDIQITLVSGVIQVTFNQIAV